MARDNSTSLRFLGISVSVPNTSPIEFKLQYSGKIKCLGVSLVTPYYYKMEFCGIVKFWGFSAVDAPESILFYQIN